MNAQFVDASVADIYQGLAQALLRCLPERWQQATLNFEWLAEDAVKDSAFYYGEGEQKKTYVSLRPAGSATSDLFIALSQIMEAAGHPRWQKASFTLTPDGKFDLDFVYPDGNVEG